MKAELQEVMSVLGGVNHSFLTTNNCTASHMKIEFRCRPGSALD